MKILSKIGIYFLMLKSVFGKYTKWKILKQLILKDIDTLIIGSLGIVSFISFFVGGVVAIQTALNLENPLLPKNLIGFATRQSVILEFAPTFISIIMAGKVGSYITSSIGTMRVTEQIDALEVMGNQYLQLPHLSKNCCPLVVSTDYFSFYVFRDFWGIYCLRLRWLFVQYRIYRRNTNRFYSISRHLCVYQNLFLFIYFSNYSLLPWILYDRRSA